METCDAPAAPVTSPSLDTLEHRITELAAHIHAATYRLLCLIAERERANALHRERCVRFHHDDGAVVIEARLPPETGAIVLDALAAAGEAMYRRRRSARDDSAESSPPTGIETVNRSHGLDIDARTCVSRWDGTVMDYHLAVDGLLERDGAMMLEDGCYPAHFPRN